MHLLLLQTAPTWLDAAASIANADRLLRANRAAEADMIVLPEMWSTGFVVAPTADVARQAATAVAAMQAWAEQYDAAVVGTVALRDEAGLWRNRCIVARPGGAPLLHYDKRHLFRFGGEHQRYAAGEARVTLTWRGWRVLLQTCYDLRFPCFSRNAAAEPYDLCLYLASWPAVRRLPWDVLLRARAIENVAYVAGVNRVGNDPSCHYSGGTALINARGEYVVSPIDEVESAVHAVLSLDALQGFRRKFPVLTDAD